MQVNPVNRLQTIMKTTIPQDAALFLETLLFAYHDEDSIEGKTIYDFSLEFTESAASFCEAFRSFLQTRLTEDEFDMLDDSPRSFGGNVYFSLSGHGCGFWDDSETEHLQPLLLEFSGSKYRFEQLELSEDENGKLDLSYLPEFIADYRSKMFTPAITR